MARYTGPVCRLCRREGTKLFLKGERCYSGKCSVDKRSYPPGHGRKQRAPKQSEYGLQLREKQKLRRTYGVLERQFARYFKKAEQKRGVTGENLLQILELRLDNVVYRLGFASSRPEARQLVRHGHFTVNGRKVNIPSYEVKLNDIIAVKEGSKALDKFKMLAEALSGREPVAWLELDKDNLVGRVIALPKREDIDVPVEESRIVELYSK
jgi:small subunit ribosomal protein S4